MTIKIKTACQVAGEHADEGALLVIGKDVEKLEAEKLVRMGRAEFVEKKAKKTKAAKNPADDANNDETGADQPTGDQTGDAEGDAE